MLNADIPKTPMMFILESEGDFQETDMIYRFRGFGRRNGSPAGLRLKILGLGWAPGGSLGFEGSYKKH